LSSRSRRVKIIVMILLFVDFVVGFVFLPQASLKSCEEHMISRSFKVLLQIVKGRQFLE